MKIFELRGILSQEAGRLEQKKDLNSGLKADCVRRMLAKITEERNEEELNSFDAVIEVLESIKESVGDSKIERSLRDVLAAHTNRLGFIGGEASAHRNVLDKIAASFESEEMVNQMSVRG